MKLPTSYIQKGTSVSLSIWKYELSLTAGILLLCCCITKINSNIIIWGVNRIRQQERKSPSMLIKIQLDATVCRYLFTAKSLYMFWMSQHPPSGVLKTVTAASGTGTGGCGYSCSK